MVEQLRLAEAVPAAVVQVFVVLVVAIRQL